MRKISKLNTSEQKSSVTCEKPKGFKQLNEFVILIWNLNGNCVWKSWRNASFSKANVFSLHIKCNEHGVERVNILRFSNVDVVVGPDIVWRFNLPLGSVGHRTNRTLSLTWAQPVWAPGLRTRVTENQLVEIINFCKLMKTRSFGICGFTTEIVVLILKFSSSQSYHRVPHRTPSYFVVFW